MLGQKQEINEKENGLEIQSKLIPFSIQCRNLLAYTPRCKTNREKKKKQ
jgi:hypothetical protein